jgi:thioredoxin-related protein
MFFRRKYLMLVCFAACSLVVCGQHPDTPEEAKGLVKWLSFKEAFELNKKQPKPFIIDVYTDWCGWCKQMMKTTYSNPDLASYINTWFYPVKFDAETKDTIEYLGTVYAPAGTTARSTHPLALKLLNNNLMYPTTIFTNYSLNFTLNSQGYLDAKKIEPVLVYTLENIFRTTAFEEFRMQFEKTFYDTAKPLTEVNWYSLKEALALNKKNPRKIIIDLHTGWCTGCKVMNRTTFADTLNAAYLNKTFYLVDFNAETKDTITFNGTVFINNGSNGTPFHPLAMAFVKNNMVLPSLVILDENIEGLDIIPQYLSPATLAPILRFYGTNAFKTSGWPDYLKSFSSKK